MTILSTPKTALEQSIPTPSAGLPCYPTPQEAGLQNPLSIVEVWAAKAERVLTQDTPKIQDLEEIFCEDSWFRDSLVVSWDLRTLHGLQRIHEYLASGQTQCLTSLKLNTTEVTPAVESVSDGLVWVSAVFKIETPLGRGDAVVRLVDPKATGSWKALVLYTALQEIKGCEEPIGSRRPQGGNAGTAGEGLQPTWQEQRERQINFADEDPAVIIIGAGQAGLSLAARLQMLGVTALIVDRNKRIGDNWRSRYRTLVTHDPVSISHMPYLPFPTTWPLYTPKDKLADWLEIYASVLELNVWLSSSVDLATYNDKSAQWEINISRDVAGQPSVRTLRPRHLVMATGHAGEAKLPAFPGQSSFKGQVYHASAHTDAADFDVKNKKVVIIGTGNSGHDIAQNFYENGAEVTLVQRGGTAVTRAATCVDILWRKAVEDSGPKLSTDTKDLIAHSLPMPVQFALSRRLTAQTKLADKDLLDKLTKAGFLLDFGLNDAGLYHQYLTRGGGYYVDVGCSQLIGDGLIKVKASPQGIQGFSSSGLVLKTGETLDADIVIAATGYDNMRTTVRKVLGDTVANRCRDIWDLDAEGELNAVWRPSGHPGFWYMAGNLTLCRPYSKVLALQIKAAELGFTS